MKLPITLAGLALVAALAACGSVHPAVRHTAAPAAVVTPAAVTTTPAAPTTCQRLVTWADRTAVSRGAVTGDLARLQADSGSYNLAALGSDAGSLTRDAESAMTGPLPPTAAMPYGKAMAAFAAAGIEIEYTTNYRLAARDLKWGTRLLDRATAAIRSCGS
jgi:hypothetical protein